MAVSQKLLAPLPSQYFSDAGKPLAGGSVYVYKAGTLVLATVYANATGGALSNPVSLNAAGRVANGQIYFDSGNSYDVQVKLGNTTTESYSSIVGLPSQETSLVGATIVDEFTGTGVKTQYSLTTDPVSIDNIQVIIDGLILRKTVDYALTDTTLTFVAAPALNAQIVVRYSRAFASEVPASALRNKIVDTFTTVSNQYAYNLSTDPKSVNNLTVVLDGFVLTPTVDYTLAGVVLTLTQNPGVKQLVVQYNDILPITGTTSDVITYSTTGQYLTNYLDNNRVINVKDFGAVGNGSTDDTFAINNAIDIAWRSGKPLYIPSGTYLISSTLNIPPGGGYEYRADSFTMRGDGAGNGFLGYNLSHGTTIITNTDIPILTYTNYLSNGNNLFIDKIRFQQNLATATNPVLYLQIFTAHSEISNCEIRQGGVGDGIKIDYAYEGTISNCRVMNKDLVAPSGATRVGTGLNISAGTGSGGLLELRRVSSRGWLNAYSVGNAANGILSTIMRQCECSTVTNGIILNTGLKKTVIDTCYFEGVYGTCILDKGQGTTVKESFFFEGYTIGIDSTNTGTYGNCYTANEFQVNSNSSTCIALYSDGDALGHKKVVDKNFIYYLSSGGALTNVVGISITGANPCVDIINNTFRPRRAWVGGTGTTKILDNSTGYNTGTTVLTDALIETSVISNADVAYNPYPTNLTESNVVGGKLTINPAHWNIINCSVATNISQIDDGAKGNRQIMLINSNTNATLVKGVFMILASNFTGYGCIVLQLRVIAGQTYAYEISRTMY